MTEEWRPIPGVAGYEASSNGRIRSITRSITTRSGVQVHAGTVLALPVGGNGYQLVTCSPPRKKHYVHVLVAKAFHGDRSPEGLRVLHADDNRLNNDPKNLRWGTQRDNLADAIANGRIASAIKPNCIRGHPLSGDNVHFRIRNGRKHRVCRACKKIRG